LQIETTSNARHDMQSIEVAETAPEVGAVAGHIDRLGSVLIAIHEAGAGHSIKADLLDEVVLIVRRGKRPEECVRDIARAFSALIESEPKL
jgi:hypothetical protein